MGAMLYCTKTAAKKGVLGRENYGKKVFLGQEQMKVDHRSSEQLGDGSDVEAEAINITRPPKNLTRPPKHARPYQPAGKGQSTPLRGKAWHAG